MYLLTLIPVMALLIVVPVLKLAYAYIYGLCFEVPVSMPSVNC